LTGAEENEMTVENGRITCRTGDQERPYNHICRPPFMVDQDFLRDFTTVKSLG
jgi:hypothetical protein